MRLTTEQRAVQSANSIRRATTDNIRIQRQRLQTYRDSNPSANIGPFYEQYVATEMARLPLNQVSEPLTAETLPPMSNTHHQLQFLDQQMDQHNQDDQAQDRSNLSSYKQVWVMTNGHRHTLLIDIVSLRDAMGLPPFNLTGVSSFTLPQYPLPAGGDIPDFDHAE